jgi:Tol biopolymer transport system component
MLIGTMLGPYEIQAKLGEGGMGEVYKARDTRLDRTVAIKVLPTELSADPERRARFEREARAVAALNHPHICTLHDIGEAVPAPCPLPLVPVHYLVMEHLPGQTLADRLLKGPLPLAQALDIAAQIADALTAAHKQGIIHRDLKPGNVMLTPSGAGRSGVATAKLLDFGLAKLAHHGERPALVSETHAVTEAAPLTARGTILGTLQYMAPEQLEGKEADARTDLWALGAILYEMLTAKRAFAGDSQVSLIGNIMNAEPAALATLQPLTPPALERVVKKCLAKNADARWQTASDLADELRWVRDSRESAEGRAGSRGAKRRTQTLTGALILAALCLAAIVIALWTWRTPRQTATAAPAVSGFVQLTDQPGRERFPSLSPDGKLVVYASQAAGNWDIYLQRVGGRNPINLTRDCLDDDSQPAFSPDGESIAFRSERDGGGIFIMGATGESVRRLTDEGYNPAWSPDGQEIAFGTEASWDVGSRNAVSQLWAVDVHTGERRLVSQGDGVQPAWSPHGHRIAYWQYKGGQRDIVTVPARGGTAVVVTDDAAMDWSPAWSPDGSYLYFSGNRGGSMNLWRVPIDERSGRVLGAFEPVTTPSLYGGDLGFSRDGALLVYAAWSTRSALRKVGFDARTGTSVGQPLPAAAPAGSQPSASPDGRRLAFVYSRNQDDIFIVRTDGTELRQLTNDSYRDLGPQWFPDGERILFFSNRSGRFQVWAIKADGSGRAQLSETADEMWYPTLSPDGRRVAAFDSRARTASVFDVGVPWNAQSPELLPAVNDRGGGFQPSSWSPDGRRLAGTEVTANGRRRGILLYSFDDRRYRTLTESGSFAVWLQDNRRLLCSADGKLNVLDSQSGAVREILSVAPLSFARGLSISADNRTIYFSIVEDEGDVWLASLR